MIARAALVLAIVGMLAALIPTAEARPEGTMSPAPAGATTLQSDLADYVAGLGGSYGVAAVSLEDGSAAFVDADTIFPTASMYKLLVMYRVFQQLEAGAMSLSDPLPILPDDMIMEGESGEGFWPGDVPSVGEALHGMIAVSSNTAAYALTRAVGGWPAVTSAADEVGMYSTFAAEGEFWSTPADLLTFFQLLADLSLVSADASEQMIDLLLAQQSNDRIPALLPEGVEVAHKTGELQGVRNDGGIVRGPGGRYILVVMSRWADPDEAVAAEARISRMVYDRYGV
ncbi:MAG: serine hydrolase [Chloroflexota bacterium]